MTYDDAAQKIDKHIATEHPEVGHKGGFAFAQDLGKYEASCSCGWRETSDYYLAASFLFPAHLKHIAALAGPPPQDNRIAELFRKLWGLGHDSRCYCKRDWGELQKLLQARGIKV